MHEVLVRRHVVWSQYVFVCESYAHKSMGLWSNNIFIGGFLYLIQMLVKTYTWFGLKIFMDVQGSSMELY
jgi:hypothetical protein